MPANKTREEWRTELQEGVEAVARRVVLEETDAWDAASEQAAEIAESFRSIADRAREAGFETVAEVAGALRAGVDSGRSPESMVNDIERLQDALAAPAAADAAPSAAPEPVSLGLDPELLADFVIESREHLGTIENELLVLEQNPAHHDSLHSAFRGFHTIKGLAGFLDLGLIQQVAHEVETLLDLARNGELSINPELIDVVLAGADYLKASIQVVEDQLNGRDATPVGDDAALIARVQAAAVIGQAPEEDAPEGAATLPSPEPEEGSTAEDTTGEDNAAPAQEDPAAVTPDEEPAPPRANGKPRAAKPKVTGKSTPKPSEDAPPPSSPAAVMPAGEKAPAARGGGKEMAAVKVNTGKLDHLVDMVGELVVAQSLLSHDPDVAAVQNPRLQRNLSQLSRITSDVQRTAMSMRMVPVDNLFRRMARLVRDVARKEGKRAELATSGNDTELDRNIVEALADPVMHMVRNAVGHGLETAEERRAAGKPETGIIKLSAYHQSGFINIDLADDGRGLSRKKILAKARQRGLLAEGAELNDREIQNLIFEPGFSTAAEVSDVSGRGVGMDVVRKNIIKLRGRVEIDSVEGRGTTFSLKVPLTLAIIEGLIVGVGNHRYIVPIYAVREMLRPAAEAMSTVQGREEMVTVRGRLLPVVRLYRRFGITPRSEDPTQSLLLVTETLGKQYCVMVDELIGKQEVVIKSLGETLKNIPGVAGGAILGDGHVGLILDMDGVFGTRTHA